MKQKAASILENQKRFIDDKGVRSIPNQFGFDWGHIKVRRVASTPNSRGNFLILTVTTSRKELEITITPSGLIRTCQIDMKNVR